MQNKTDESFGVVPVKKINNIWYVFLIHQVSWVGDTYWTFPKGHAMDEETPIQTAKRELYEETGLTADQIFENFSYQNQYDFIHEGVKIDKTVTYFLTSVNNQQSDVDTDEVKESGWFTLATAREKVSHDSSRQIIDLVERDLITLETI